MEEFFFCRPVTVSSQDQCKVIRALYLSKKRKLKKILKTTLSSSCVLSRWTKWCSLNNTFEEKVITDYTWLSFLILDWLWSKGSFEVGVPNTTTSLTCQLQIGTSKSICLWLNNHNNEATAICLWGNWTCPAAAIDLQHPRGSLNSRGIGDAPHAPGNLVEQVFR